MKYTKGEEIEFNIYGTTVIGEFVEFDGIDESIIVIKTTQDFIKENIGEKHWIHKSHRHCKYNG